MPVRVPSGGGGGSKGKKKSRWDRLSGTVSRLPNAILDNTEDIITGLGPGAVASFNALDKALPKSPLALFTDIDKDNKLLGDRKEAKALGKATLLAMKEDLRHPLRNPVNTALTLAAIPSLGVGGGIRAGTAISAASTASKGSKIAAAAKAARRKPMKTREIRGIRDPQRVIGDRYKINVGRVDGKQVHDIIEKRPPRKGQARYQEDTTISPLGQLVRLPIDRYHRRSIRKAGDQAAKPKFKPDAKIVIHGSKEYWKITRGSKTAAGSLRKLQEAKVGGVRRKSGTTMVVDKSQVAKQRGGGYARFQERRIKDKRKRYTDQLLGIERKPREKGTFENLANVPMDLLRTNMYASGRYAVQNNVSTALMNALAGVAPRHVNAVRKTRKNDPETYENMKRGMGQTMTGSYAAGSTGTGRLGQLTQKLAQIMSHPEGVQRTAAMQRVAEDMGMDAKTLARLLKDPNNNRTQVLMQRANERVGDLGRYGGSSGIGKAERAFVGSSLPIFYPMTKAFTRMTGRTPLMYPAKSAAGAQLGTAGHDLQEKAFGGEVNPYYGYYSPLGVKGKLKSLNVQNILPWAPGGDVVRETRNMLPGQHEDLPFLNPFNHLGPLPELLTGMATGRNLSSGFDLDDLESKGSFAAGMMDAGQHLLPGNEFYLPNESKAHGNLSWQDKLKLRAVGPALYPRDTDYKAIPKSTKKRGNKISRRNSGSGNSG